ncbi:hypothetical protein Q7C36_022396 [Tachysurus vachellii]|uniref:Uncharacterized protein n=1 Tax=Tachysurus vachellii TaxID=175792 RepID=A0AA88ILH1_TACVA|nr:hypothetical protein Q7C36_022396 [Tachysurus vachellii]
MSAMSARRDPIRGFVAEQRRIAQTEMEMNANLHSVVTHPADSRLKERLNDEALLVKSNFSPITAMMCRNPSLGGRRCVQTASVCRVDYNGAAT